MPPNREPPVTRELVEHLERLFPDRLPTDPQTSDRDIWRSVGKVDVVKYLKALHERQSNNLLENR